MWLSDTEFSRVFRINQVSSPNRFVDIVLGQTSVDGIHCNQGRDSDDRYVRPWSASQNSLCHPGGLALDPRGNLFVSDHNLEFAGNWRMLEYDMANLPLNPSTAIFGLPASRVYGGNGNFTDTVCNAIDPMCGPWEPVFYPNNQMVIGFNSYLGPAHPRVYRDPLTNPLPDTALGDFYSHAYSARLDSRNNLYVLDLTRNHVLIYRAKDPPPAVVLSITRTTPSPIVAVNVSFNVTFSEPVIGVDSSDFVLRTTGVTGATITNVSGTGTTRRVAVNTGSGIGTIRLDVVDNDSIKNEDNNRSLGDVGIDNGSFTVGEEYAIVKTHGPDTTGVFRPSNGALYLKNSNMTGFADIQINYGLGGDYPVIGDWDGDGDATIGIYRNGSFYLRNSNTIGFADWVFPFGMPGDQPVAGDWDGDGTDTIGVYRNGAFFLRNSNDAGAPEMIFGLGVPGDVGIAGDWDGDGDDTTGVFRPSNGALYLKNNNVTGFADIQINYGLGGDKPVTGDWDGDGDDTIGVYRDGAFYLRNENTIGFADWVFALGVPGDHPIAGNWDGVP